MIDLKLVSLLDNESETLRETVRTFTAQVGLEKVERLEHLDPNEPQLSLRVLERLLPFFEGGLLLQGAADSSGIWHITNLFWRGILFNLETTEQMQADGLVPEITPFTIQRAPSQKILEFLRLKALPGSKDTDSYLLRPTPNVAYVLFTKLAAHWAEAHLVNAQRLINKSFIY